MYCPTVKKTDEPSYLFVTNTGTMGMEYVTYAWVTMNTTDTTSPDDCHYIGALTSSENVEKGVTSV